MTRTTTMVGWREGGEGRGAAFVFFWIWSEWLVGRVFFVG